MKWLRRMASLVSVRAAPVRAPLRPVEHDRADAAAKLRAVESIARFDRLVDDYREQDGKLLRRPG